jgi:integrase
MAKIIKRTWTRQGPTGRRVRHVGFGYTLMLPDGTRERRVSSDWATEDDAIRALAARQTAIAAGRVAPRADRTLAELAGEYVAYKTDRGKRTVLDDARVLATRLLPALGSDLPARQLTAAAIAQYERRRMAEVSAYTVALELAVLRHMLRLARRWGYLDEVPEIEMPKKPEGRQRYLDEAEIARLLDACRPASTEHPKGSRNPHLATIVTIAINTGMRKGEILGLTWERTDLASARLTLYDTKNSRPRGVPVNRAVYEALIALEPDGARRSGLLFRRSGDRAWGKIRTAFEKAVEGAELKDFRFHDLRHTVASHMVMRGATLKEVQEILGHRTFAMTLPYAHLSPAHLRGAVDRLDGLTPAVGKGATMTQGMAQKGKIEAECRVSA